MSRRISHQDPKVKEEEERYERNVAKVKFTPATTKDVCSTHSGSILAADDPVVPLSSEFEEKIRKLFDSAEGGCIKRAELANVLVDCFGFTEYDGLNKVVDKIYGKSDGDEVSESDFTGFLLRFHAPSYYYGQRMRRSAGRGLVAETMELIMRGCSPNTADGEGLTALHYASEFNQKQVITRLAQLCPPGMLILDARCKYGWTPLYCAAHHGNTAVVELLLKLGASCELCNFVGKTPLHAAAAQGRLGIVDMIVVESAARAHAARSIRASQRSPSPTLPEGEAGSGSSEGGAGATPPGTSDQPSGRTRGDSRAEQPEPSAPLLVNRQDKHGMTALHEAAYKGQDKVFQLLRKVPGADLNIADVMGNLPADYFEKIKPAR